MTRSTQWPQPFRHNPPDVVGLYERTVGHILERQHHVPLAASHFSRARRLYEAIQYNPGLVELEQAGLHDDSPTTAADVGGDLSSSDGTAITLDAVATVLVMARRPEFVTRELSQLLWTTGLVTG